MNHCSDRISPSTVHVLLLSPDLCSHMPLFTLLFFSFFCLLQIIYTNKNSQLVLPAMLEHAVPLVAPWLIVSNVNDGSVPGRDELSHKCGSLEGLIYTHSQP